MRWVAGLAVVTLALVARADGKPVPAPMPATADRVLGLLENLGAKEKDTERRLQSLRAETVRLDSLVRVRGRAYVRAARAGLLPVSGGFEALVDHASRLERMRRALSRDLDRQRAVSVQLRNLAREVEALRDRRNLLDTDRAALERSHTAILAAEERELAFRQAFMGSFRPDHMAVYGSGPGPLDPVEIREGFAAMKGRLSFPVAGRTEIRSAERPGAGGVGLELEGAGGEVARAVYPGRVAFADSYADYGPTVIVDHGGGYFSVTGGLGMLGVRAGAELAAGDALGKVDPSTGTLYFELRRGAEVIDPAPWFGL